MTRIRSLRLRGFRGRAIESLESRVVPATVADPADLFGPTETANASGTYPSPAFAAANVVDRTNGAFVFADGSGPQRLALSNFSAAITSLRFFDTPSYTDRAAGSVTIYYSPLRQMSLVPSSYTLLGAFSLPTTNTGGGPQGDVYQTPTNPPDHPQPADPSGNPAATISYDQLNGLAIPPGTQSILLDFGSNSAGLGFGFSEIQALGYRSPDRAPDPTFLAWGQNVYQKINASLKVAGSNLYAEMANISGTTSGGDSGFAYVWPEATLFRVLDDLAGTDRSYAPTVRAFADELYTRYWTTTAPGGYRSGVSSGATSFYDDNGHVAVALAQAYELTGDPVYLGRAIQTYQFVLSGEDSAGGGGIYFSVPDHSSKDAISTLQAVRAGLLLYRLTGQSQYLSDATQLYGWAASHIQQSNGLVYQRWQLTGTNANTPQGTPLINGAGIGLADNLLFYDFTGDVSYLREAQLIATTSIPRYFNSSSGAINDEGYWDFELVDALNALYQVDHNPAWLSDVTGALTWLHANREDPNGHYGTLWGRESYTPGTIRTSWNMIDQAAVAESYLRTASVNLTAPPFVTAAGDAITGFYQGSIGGNDVPSSVGTGPGQYPSAQGPANAIDANGATKYLNFGNGDSSASSATKGVGTGFYVTPAAGPTVVTGIQVATGNDHPARDPLSVAVEGTDATSNFDTGSTWSFIAQVNLGIDTDPGRQTFGPLVRFNNTTPYRSYRVIVLSQRGSDNSVQYSEMKLAGTVAAPTVQSVAINGGAAQRSMVTSITVTFNEAVTLGAGAFVLTPDAGGATVGLSQSVSVVNGQTVVTLTFTGPGIVAGSLADGRYTLRVVGSQVTDSLGTTLDGDGDGQPGGDSTTALYRLYGDANGDRRVDNADFFLLKQTFLRSTGDPLFLSALDSDGSGTVDNADFFQFKTRFGTAI
ncbi:MAG TPA: glycoside hydrolase family 76 protein [Gemmataceae bacterium]|nr:glycoside hydrolase family 76 protein [Gemmataceae bacterium]